MREIIKRDNIRILPKHIISNKDFLFYFLPCLFLFCFIPFFFLQFCLYFLYRTKEVGKSDVAQIFFIRAHISVSRDSTSSHQCRAILLAYRGGLRDLRGQCHYRNRGQCHFPHRNRGQAHLGRAGGRHSRLGSIWESVQT